MRRLSANFMVWLLVVGYFMTAIGAAWLHRHDHSPVGHQAAAHHIHIHGGHHHHSCHHDGGQLPSPRFHRHDHENVPIPISHDDDCFVCQFLAKTSTAAIRVAIDKVDDIVFDIAGPILTTPDSPVFGLAQSRAPPSNVT